MLVEVGLFLSRDSGRDFHSYQELVSFQSLSLPVSLNLNRQTVRQKIRYEKALVKKCSDRGEHVPELRHREHTAGSKHMQGNKTSIQA